MEPTAQSMGRLNAQCCIAGGGPAGVMAGYLLARAGVDVIVLEKHQDFLRDFRGDTVHPSTLEVLYELGLLEGFLQRTHQQYRKLSIRFGDIGAEIADCTHLPTHCKFIALMPQWDFLNYLTEAGRKFPGFQLRTQYEVTDLLEEGGRIAGVKGKTPNGAFELRAQLTIGADGRHSVVREKARLEIEDLGAPMDVLWMRLPKKPDDSYYALGHLKKGKMLVTINRGDYWQCAYIIFKGAFPQIQQRGLPAFRDDIADVAPFLADRTDTLRDWKDISLLSVRVDRLRSWSCPGLLCIGDSAHAMSPVGGIGINLAIQDAVATANILAEPLRRNQVTHDNLRAVENRRIRPTRWTQALQVQAHKRVVEPTLSGQATFVKLPFVVSLLNDYPWLRRFPARLIGMGLRPEHVRIPPSPISTLDATGSAGLS
jgi:2-polyprenyl-6-methoxyphenol hydroxylase-like FAD-dependent oxidoreductase